MLRLTMLLSVLIVTTLGSDIARPYTPGKEPGLVAGTAASNAAGAGTPEVPGKEKASLVNQHLAHNYGDTAK